MIETYLALRIAMLLCTLFTGVALINIVSGVSSWLHSRSKAPRGSQMLASAHSK